MSPQIARMVVGSFQRNPHSPLSSRETEILASLASGKTYKDTADELNIGMETVKSHVKNIYGKLHASSKTEAIRIANDTPYGLAAYMQTGDNERAERVAAKLRAGAVHINGGGMEYGTPFGGYKQSGNGREGGMLGLDDYQEVKTLHFG